MNCIIVDDEQMSRDAIEHCIRQTDFLNLVKSCSSPIEALKVLQKENIDLIFLDVEMPEMSGFDLIKNLKQLPQIILITAKKNYALEAFEYHVTDYLVKPVNAGRFLKAVLHAKELHEKENHISISSEYIFVKSSSKFIQIKTKDILWIEALGDYVNIYTGKERITVLTTMKDLENKLSPAEFARVHRSYIVRLDKIKTIEDTMILIDQKAIPVGKSYKDNLMARLNLI